MSNEFENKKEPKRDVRMNANALRRAALLAVCNPLTALVAAYAIVNSTFALLGWSE